MKKKIVLLTTTVALGSIALFGCGSDSKETKATPTKCAVTSDAASSDAISTKKAASSDAIKYNDDITKEDLEVMTPLFSGLQSYMYTNNSTYDAKDDAFYYNTLIWSVNSCASNETLDVSTNSNDLGTVSKEELNEISSALFSENGEIDPAKIPQDLATELSYDEKTQRYSVHAKDLNLLSAKVISVTPIKDHDYEVHVNLMGEDGKSLVATFEYVLKSTSEKYLSVMSVSMTKVSDVSDTSTDSNSTSIDASNTSTDSNSTLSSELDNTKSLDDANTLDNSKASDNIE